MATAETDPQAIAVSFADADHGYALSGRCQSTSGPCHYTFKATADGGRSWQVRGLPIAPVMPPDGYSADMLVIGPTSVLVDDRGWRWFSNDAGLSWQQPPAPTITPVPAVPPGTRVTGSGPFADESPAGCRPPLPGLQPRT